MNTVRAILFDYGGVLADEGFSDVLQALAREQDLAVENMTHEGMLAVYDSGFVLGTGSEADFWALLRERTGLQGDDAEHRARMFEGFAIRPAMLELVDRMRAQGYVTGILSDQTNWLNELDARDHFYQHFDHVYNSYYLGKGKREASQFSDVANALGLPPSEILFIDDSKGHVERAQSVGMKAIRYVDYEALVRELVQYGIGLPDAN